MGDIIAKSDLFQTIFGWTGIRTKIELKTLSTPGLLDKSQQSLNFPNILYLYCNVCYDNFANKLFIYISIYLCNEIVEVDLLPTVLDTMSMSDHPTQVAYDC